MLQSEKLRYTGVGNAWIFFILSTKHGIMVSKYTVAQDSSLCRKLSSSELPSLRAENLHFRR